MVAPSAIIGFLISKSTSFPILILLLIVIALYDIGANVLNNYSDWSVDIINKKRNGMHTHTSQKSLLLTYLFLTILLPIPLFLLHASLYLIISVIFGVFLGIFYSIKIKFKDITPLNYISIALAYAAIPISIGFFSGSANISTFTHWLPLIIWMSLVTFSYTITKDYPDIPGDALHNKKTLPVMFGKHTSIIIQFFLISLSYALLFMFIIFGYLPNFLFITFISFFFAIFILNKAYHNESEYGYKKIALYNKINHFTLRMLVILILLIILYI